MINIKSCFCLIEQNNMRLLKIVQIFHIFRYFFSILCFTWFFCFTLFVSQEVNISLVSLLVSICTNFTVIILIGFQEENSIKKKSMPDGTLYFTLDLYYLYTIGCPLFPKYKTEYRPTHRA